LTQEQLLDTSIEDARAAEAAGFAEQLQAEGLARGDKEAIELDRLIKRTEQDLVEKRGQAQKGGSEK
jgi:hypothetical protein